LRSTDTLRGVTLSRASISFLPRERFPLSTATPLRAPGPLFFQAVHPPPHPLARSIRLDFSQKDLSFLGFLLSSSRRTAPSVTRPFLRWPLRSVPPKEQTLYYVTPHCFTASFLFEEGEAPLQAPLPLPGLRFLSPP